MGGFSIWHWLIVLAIALLIFGTKRLTSGARDLGKAVNEFKKGMRGEDDPAASPPAAQSGSTPTAPTQDARGPDDSAR